MTTNVTKCGTTHPYFPIRRCWRLGPLPNRALPLPASSSFPYPRFLTARISLSLCSENAVFFEFPFENCSCKPTSLSVRSLGFLCLCVFIFLTCFLKVDYVAKNFHLVKVAWSFDSLSCSLCREAFQLKASSSMFWAEACGPFRLLEEMFLRSSLLRYSAGPLRRSEYTSSRI